MKGTSTYYSPLSVTEHSPLPASRLRGCTDPEGLDLDTLKPDDSPLTLYRQPRAEKALTLGIRMAGTGHIFVCGPPGTDRKGLVEAALRQHARPYTEVFDYLSIFPTSRETRRPHWICLPAGKGRMFQQEIDTWIRACQDRIRREAYSRPGPRQRTSEGTSPADREPRLEARLRDRLAQCRQQQFGPEAIGYLEAFKIYLLETVQRSLEQALVPPSRKGSGQASGDLLEAAEGLSELRSALLREAPPGGQVPVVFEPNPTLRHLFGYGAVVENRRAPGSPATLILEAGSLLRAQGGYLLLDFHEVASEPDTWRHLKRCLQHEQLELAVPSLAGTGAPSAGLLRPKPIPLKVTVVAWGDERLFQEFYERDPGFSRLFRIRADLDSQIDRTQENIQAYLAFLNRCRTQDGLLAFHKTGAARFIDAGAELAGTARKLSARWEVLADLAREASFLARQEGSPAVHDRHVELAVREDRFRKSLPEQQLHDLILENTVLIQTDGSRVGQVNGIALYETEDYLFGKPCRITAQTGMGRAGVVNIEREANLSGKLHDKGVLILCGFLRNRFAQNKPLTLSASICIEQFYSEIDGDSASLGEACALLSSLANVPLRQGIAVTGSINQKGDVQPIGCVNEKIVGFFEVCQDRGLTGGQGVIIPAGNTEDLMLPREIVEAVEKGYFHVYAVHSVDQAMEILTGRTAGDPDRSGQYPQGSLNSLVDERLWTLAVGLRDFMGDEEWPEEGEDGTPHAE